MAQEIQGGGEAASKWRKGARHRRRLARLRPRYVVVTGVPPAPPDRKTRTRSYRLHGLGKRAAKSLARHDRSTFNRRRRRHGARAR